MKSRNLPETDIANIAFRSVSEKSKMLEAWLKPRQGSGSYNPFRQTSGDAINRQLPLYPEGQVRTPWEKLEQLVVAKCRGDEQLLGMNIPVARSTHDFAVATGLTAEPIDMRSLTLAGGERYDFGQNLLLRFDGGVAVAFPDLRRTGQLSLHGRRVAFSVMHQRFRENFPDNSSLALQVWRYRNNDDRSIEVIHHTDEPLYTYEELSADFSETYSIFNALRSHADNERRNKGGDQDYGPLFGT